MSRFRLHPERVDAGYGAGTALVVAAVAALGVTGAIVAGNGGISPEMGIVLGGLAGMLAVAGLPSVSLRSVGRGVALVAAVVVARFGVLTGPVRLDVGLITTWITAVVALLVISHHIPVRPTPDAAPPRRGLSSRPGVVTGQIGGITVVLLLVAALLAPSLAPSGPDSASGDDPQRPSADGAYGLIPTETLDMTQRPRLSDEVVMRVRTDHLTFWRTGTFDDWDGRTWTQTTPDITPTPDGRIDAASDDLGADGTDEIRQTFTLETPFAAVLPMAPTAIDVDGPVGLYQQPDGSMIPHDPLGPGSRYTVTSRRVPLTEGTLRSTGEIPGDVAERYAAPPVATDRVLAAARRATAEATTTYDKVRALESWMGARARYSLDAPTAPEGVDVVDHFLFESRQGWCEQIASSLVVLARALGIPARLAVGFVPGERDPINREVVVRERNAHAWAEVWFPEVGWVAFDPTADVPLAGEDEIESLTGTLVQAALVVVAVVLVGALLVFAGRRLLGRVRRRRRVRAQPAVGLEVALDRLGERVGRPRAAGETASRHAADLAERVGHPDLADVGRLVDDALYAAEPPAAERWAEAGAVVAQAASSAGRGSA